MNFAIIENNTVVNKIIAEQSFIDSNNFTAIDITELTTHPNIGDTWNGTEFVAPVVTTIPTE